MTLNSGHDYVDRIDAKGAGTTVLAYLVRWYRHSDEATWRARIARGEVEVGERVATPDLLLNAGDRVTWHRPPWDEPDVPTDWHVLHVDDDLLAVSKPSGLPTMPAGGFSEHTLLAFVQARFPEAKLMHRLGRGTSGLVLFARTDEAASVLQRMWRTHEIRKTYRALASGRIERDTFEIATPIGEVPHPVLGSIFAATSHGKRSRSIVTVLERRADATLCEVEIETGRPHQIRIHLASVGHPLVGDPLYAPGGLPLPDLQALPGDGGYLLHAARLAFTHPRTGTPTNLEAPPPPPLESP